VQLALTRQLAEQRDWTGVQGAVQRIHEQGGRSAETLTLRGIAYREQQDLDDAEQDLRAAVKLDGSYAPAHAALAVVLDLRGKGAAAEEHHRRAIELAPENPHYLNDWGFSLLMRNKTEEAIATLRSAVDLAPLEPRIRNNLGFAFARAGDFVRAEQQFKLGGSRAEALNNLGFGYETSGNLAQAFDAYREAARLDPSLARARGNLTYVARKLDRAVPAEATAPADEPRDERRTP
jgi:Flp pilus assembly protein TadD